MNVRVGGGVGPSRIISLPQAVPLIYFLPLKWVDNIDEMSHAVQCSAVGTAHLYPSHALSLSR